MSKRKRLRLVQSTTHERPEQTPDRTELEQLLAKLNVTEDQFIEWQRIIRAMRESHPGAEDLTFDELGSLAQRRAERYQRFLVGNDDESDEDADLLGLTEREQVSTVLTIPVDQVQYVFSNAQTTTSFYLYAAAVVALCGGLILVVYSNRPLQPVEENVRKETSLPTLLVSGKKPGPAPIRRAKRPEKKDTKTPLKKTSLETPIPLTVQQFVQELPAMSATTVGQAQSVSSSEQVSPSNVKINHSSFGLASRDFSVEQFSETKTSAGVEPYPSSNPRETPVRMRGPGNPS